MPHRRVTLEAFGDESAWGRRQPFRADTVADPRPSCVVMRNDRPRARRSIAALAPRLVPPAASFAAGPNFDAVTWRPLGCDTPDLISPDSPSSASFAGDHANLPAYYAYDADYLYFRYRMDTNPASGGGFAQYVWTALMQVPSGQRFHSQHHVSLDR